MISNSADNISINSSERIIYGLGETGLSIARYLYSTGEKFSVYDSRANPPRLEDMQAEMPDISFFSGEHTRQLSNTQGEIFISPGVPPSDPLIIEAINNGATVKSDLDLFVAKVDSPIVGITGSNGKTTVTELVGLMAVESGAKVGVGGNFGTPALDLISVGRDIFVLELSSFQLEHSGPLNLSIAAILNLSPDHLDRHQTVREYSLAKQKIFNGCDIAVVNRNDLNTQPFDANNFVVHEWGLDEAQDGGVGLRGLAGDQEIVFNGHSLMPVNELSLSGNHHLMNSLAALAIGISAGFPTEAMCQVLRKFSGLAHRCELVSSTGGVSWINDSKATNIGATRTALESFGGEQNIILIAGGISKGARFEYLRDSIKKHCKEVILLGNAAKEFSAAISDETTVNFVDSIEDAVKLAKLHSASGDLVLLSPACSSFDMFRDYIERGDHFRSAVSLLADIV